MAIIGVRRVSWVFGVGSVLAGSLAAACHDEGADAEEGVALEDPLAVSAAACRRSRDLQAAALGRSIDLEDPAWTEGVGDAEHGRHEFRRRKFHAVATNGRACADCHDASDSFQLSPASVRARFDALQECRRTRPDADDPLFRPIDADDFVTNGEQASDYRNLVDNGLVRVRLPLPSNVKLVDPASCKTATGAPAPCQTAAVYSVSSETVADVWRAVPSVIAVAETGPDGVAPFWPRDPNPAGGYQLDARVDTLQNQALGALKGHAQMQGEPQPRTLDAIASFQKAVPIPVEPVIAAGSLEAEGKKIFERACVTCHGGRGGTTSVNPPELAPPKRYHDIGSACPRPVDTANPPRWDFAAAAVAAGRPTPCPPSEVRNARTYEITFADGFKVRRTTTDPGRLLLTGFLFSAPPPVPPAICAHAPCGPSADDDFQKLDVMPLRGISKTAPYFHNNSAATLEDVVIHYEEFFKRVSANNATAPRTPGILTTGMLCSDPRCTGTVCSQDGLCRDRPNLPSERAALVAYLKRL